jgi:hypothetical protein
MTSCILVALPEAVTREVLIEWLWFDHVVRLDTAFCVNGTRAQYLRVAYAEENVYPRGGCHYNSSDLQWCLDRSVQLRGVYMDLELMGDDKPLQQYLVKHGKSIDWLNIEEAPRLTATEHLFLWEIGRWCPKVRRITLSAPENPRHEHWNDDLIKLLRSCPKLSELSLVNLPLTTLDLGSALRQHRKLVELKISHVYEILPVEVARPSLKKLDVSCCIVSDAVMIAIGGNCSLLHTLYVFEPLPYGKRLITDVGVRAVLQGCPLLRETDVEHAVGISNNLRVELAHRRHFSAPSFVSWKGMTDDLACKLLAIHPNLSEFRCTGMVWQLSDNTLATCAKHCPHLSLLALQDCTAVTSEGVLSLHRSGNKLVTIRLTNCPQLGEEVVLAIGQHCPLLEICCLQLLGLVTDAAVVKLAEGCPLLESVSIAGCSVSDIGVTALVTRCPRLETLEIIDCSQVTYQGVRAIAEHRKHLNDLWLPTRFAKSSVVRLFGDKTAVRFEDQ